MRNVLGTTLQLCSRSPLTGYHRDGFCKTDNNDKGRHVIASIMTEKFLAFTRSKVMIYPHRMYFMVFLA